MFLRFRKTIAGAVACEIMRIHQTGDPIGEGAAYKAAMDEKGSSAEKHCTAAKADRDIMNQAVRGAAA